MDNGSKRPVAVIEDTWCPDRIEIANPAGCVHSEEFVIMFLGYMCAQLPDLKTLQIPKVLDAWERFKREMGK